MSKEESQSNEKKTDEKKPEEESSEINQLKDKIIKINFQDEKNLEKLEENEGKKEDKKEDNQIKQKILSGNNVTLILEGDAIIAEKEDNNVLTRKIPSYQDEDKFLIKEKQSTNEKKQNEEDSSDDSDDDDDKLPFRIIGNVKKKSERLGFINERFLEIDPIKGTYNRYKSSKDYPTIPNETIPIKTIHSVRRLEKEENKDYYELELTFTKSDEKGGQKKVVIYRITHEECRDKWFEFLSLLCRCAVRGDPLPKINKHKILFIDDQMGVIQEMVQNDKIKADAGKVSLKKFKILQLIGYDEFGTIYKVMQKKTERIFSMKVISKDYIISKKYLHWVINELDVMKLLNGFSFISDLHFAFQTANYLYIVTDYCENGNLTNIKSVNNLKLLFAEVILAIEYIHSKGYVYRDLRPENTFLDSEGHIKLCDFYLAKSGLTGKERAKSFCGAPRYLSPEMFGSQGVDQKSDIYSIGLLIYELVTGKPAYSENNVEELYKNIKENKVNLIDSEIFGEVKDLLQLILVKEPEERISLEEMKTHPYFKEINFVKVMLKDYGPIIIQKKNGDKENEPGLKETATDDSIQLNINTIKESSEKEKITIEQMKKDQKKEIKITVKDFYFVKEEHIKEIEETQSNVQTTLNKEIFGKIK